MINRILSLSIRTHLIILVCLLVFPSILLAIYSGLLERKQAIIDAQANCRRFVNTLAARQQSMVVGAEQLTMALSLLPAVQSRNADEVNSILSALPRKDIQYSIITVADKTGLIWASSIPSREKAFLTDRKYFQDVMRTGMFTSGGYVIGRITKKPILVFGTPLRNKKNVLSGVMSIGLVLDYAQDEFERAKLPAGTFFSMLDHNGIIIYTNSQNKSHKMLQGLRDIKEETFTAMRQGPDEGTFNAIGNDDNVRLFAYKKLRLAHDQEQYLYIRTSIAQASVTAVATAKMQKYLSILGLIFVLGLSVSWLIGKRAIVDRIKILESAAKKLSEGTAYVNVSSLVQGAELSKLANTFDNMSLALSEREKSLRESEERFRILSEAAFEAIAIHDGGVLISANDQYFKMFGYEPDEAIGKQMMSITIAPEAIEFAKKQMVAGSLAPYESIGIRKDGTRFPMEIRARKMDYKGRNVRFGAIVDITERKQSEEALQSSEHKYRILTEQMPDFIWHKDINSVYISCNRSYAKAVGLTVDTIAGHRDEDFYPPELVAKYLADDQHVIATGQPLKTEEMWRETGGNRWLHTSKAPLLDKSGNCIGTIGIAHDITERKQLEAERKHMELQLFQSQKMEAIGTLAGGIAHDFNNILSVIIGYAELAKDRSQKENKEHYLQEVIKGAERARNLVKQILTFSRQENHEKKPLDIKFC
jgi:PAS domain S-box-containing protein